MTGFNFVERLINYFRTPIRTVEDANPTKMINGVGEPVLSFVQCFKENPKRFKILHCWNAGDGILDKQLDIIFALSDVIRRYNPEWSDKIIDVSWLNWAEKDYLEKHIGAYYEERHLRLLDLEHIRNVRAKDKVKQRIMKLYDREG